jgi:hypothetical protein
MHTTFAPHRHGSSGRSGNRIAAMIGAVALAAAITGPAAAIPLKLDQPGDGAVSVDPSPAKVSSEFGAKLRTTSGYRVLVFE